MDDNTRRFAPGSIVIIDESGFIWGEAPLRTLASSTGLGTQVATQDKYEKVRSTMVLAVRLTDDPDGQILTPVVIPSHDSIAECRDCILELPGWDGSGVDDWPCDCDVHKVKGLHTGLWHFITENVWYDELKEGDLVVMDNLACHNNLRTRRFLQSIGVNHLPLPPKVATTRSPLDNCFFAIWKARKAVNSVLHPLTP